MLKGVLVGYAIMLAAIPIPVVHFVTLPLAPFVAGFIGGGIARADEGRITVFGLVLGGLMLIPAAVLLVVRFVAGVEELLGAPGTFWVVVAALLVPYTWFGATVGALASYLLRRNQGQTR